MAWRSLLITRPGYLSFKYQSMLIKQDEGEARVALEDIAAIVLDHPQVVISAQLLSALAEQNIALVTVNQTHTPNGILLGYTPHTRALKVMRRQLQMGKVQKKRLWQTLVQQKILNQASVLIPLSADLEVKALKALAEQVKPGDPQNYEAQASQKYFKALFGKGFVRRQENLINAALNYGYSILRSAIARHLVGYGFLPAFGLQHNSEQNAFNLADDLIEPYRPYVDAHVLQLTQSIEPEQTTLTTDIKAGLVELLHQDILRLDNNQPQGKSTLLALIEATVISLGQRLADNRFHLTLPGEVSP